MSAVAKAQSQYGWPPTFQPVSSGVTTGLPRTWAQRASSVYWLCRAVLCATRARRGLAVGTSTRHLEFFLQPLVFAPQAVRFDVRAQQILAEPFDLACLVIDDLSGIGGRRGILRAPRHDMVMPDSRGQYKRKYGSADC